MNNSDNNNCARTRSQSLPQLSYKNRWCIKKIILEEKRYGIDFIDFKKKNEKKVRSNSII